VSVQDIIAGVIEREGGYVNDPDDPGGETKYGIAKRYNPDVDIANLTKEEAARIYYDRYWKPSKADKLPEQLQEIYFDMVVNPGPYAAIKILQHACRNRGFNIAADGKLGPKTLRACQKLEPDRLRAFRVLYYAERVIKKPVKVKSYFGWFKRSIEV